MLLRISLALYLLHSIEVCMPFLYCNITPIAIKGTATLSTLFSTHSMAIQVDVRGGDRVIGGAHLVFLVSTVICSFPASVVTLSRGGTVDIERRGAGGPHIFTRFVHHHAVPPCMCPDSIVSAVDMPLIPHSFSSFFSLHRRVPPPRPFCRSLNRPRPSSLLMISP
ncbi:hypothetical protein EDD85DRAFT_349783 [Armillaria nabsnona]|nr:hypothetical protein EDD85DRAFT_349783 [Armillaria nabsnona]